MVRTGWLVAALLATSWGAQARVFGFEGREGATAPFSVVSGGVTATFTSTPGNGYQVGDVNDLLSFSPALVDQGFFNGSPLTITFSTPQVGALRIPFALLDAFSPAGQDTLTVVLDDGEVRSFGTSPYGTLQEPEGVVAFVPTAAYSVVTLSSAENIAIGDVSVPEPGSMVLLGGAMLAGLGVRRRG